jgi:2-oxoglutarate ferredoxin oxidoreductase subunit delta
MSKFIGGVVMPKITVNEDVCKGCGLCTTACPKKIIVLSDKLNAKGYHPAHVFEISKCIGCAMCAVICPDVAIRVEK